MPTTSPGTFEARFDAFMESIGGRLELDREKLKLIYFAGYLGCIESMQPLFSLKEDERAKWALGFFSDFMASQVNFMSGGDGNHG